MPFCAGGDWKEDDILARGKKETKKTKDDLALIH